MGLSTLSCCCVDQFWHDEDSSSSSSCSCGVQGGQAAVRRVQGEVQQDLLLLQRGGDPFRDLRLQPGGVGVDQDQGQLQHRGDPVLRPHQGGVQDFLPGRGEETQSRGAAQDQCQGVEEVPANLDGLERAWSGECCEEPRSVRKLLGFCHHRDGRVICCDCYRFPKLSSLRTGPIEVFSIEV